MCFMQRKIFILIQVFICIACHSLLAQSDSLSAEVERYRGRVPESLFNPVTIELKDARYEDALKTVAEKGKVRLNFNQDRILSDKKVSLKLANAPLLRVLFSLFKATGTGLVITKDGQLAVVPSDKPVARNEYRADKTPSSTIKGAVLDAQSGATLAGASVEVMGTHIGVTSAEDGSFAIDEVPVGIYVLRVSLTGYKPSLIPDVVVRSGRDAAVNCALTQMVFEMDSITVSGSYFYQSEQEPVSTVGFSHEEVRRASGTAGDVSRLVSVLPSIAKVDDTVNGLIVRGGNPVENAFYLDNMEIPNINHYPAQGSSIGPIGLINLDFLQDVNFNAGGFSSLYGDKLSSVMELNFREGNREKFQSQVDLNMIGLGLVGEGPLAGGKGSWMFSARKSYLDLLVGAIGTGVAPRYGDYQGKMVIDLPGNSSLEFLGVAGVDHINHKKDYAVDNGDDDYGDADNVEHLFGVNWKYTRGGFHSETSLSEMFTSYKYRFWATTDDSLEVTDRTNEQAVGLRNVNTLSLGLGRTLRFGVEARSMFNDYDYYFKPYFDHYGNNYPETVVRRKLNASRLGAFASFTWSVTPSLDLSPGLRLEHYTVNGNTHLQPRLSLVYRLSERTSLTAAGGVYRQSLPLTLLSQNPKYEKLNDPAAYHTVIGLSQLLSENTRLTVEVYDKQYRHFPLDPSQPALFIADEGGNRTSLTDNGRAYARGVEVVLQKKLARDLFGLVSGSYYTSRYRGYDGRWRDRIYGNRFTFSAEGGYIASKKWQYSFRWIVAGGRPYTPYDQEASKSLDSGVFDLNRINGERLPAYHSLNLRADRTFNFKNSNLVLYWDIWNVYNRKNISSYSWNETENHQERNDQWSLMPIFGLEWQF